MHTPRKTESFWELDTSIGNLELECGNWKVFYVLTSSSMNYWTKAV